MAMEAHLVEERRGIDYGLIQARILIGTAFFGPLRTPCKLLILKSRMLNLPCDLISTFFIPEILVYYTLT